MAYRVTKYQTTPNPNALKVLLDKPITDRPRSFRTPEDCGGDALASRFFAIPNVVGLLFNGDWFTVNKAAESDWPPIKKAVERELAAMSDA